MRYSPGDAGYIFRLDLGDFIAVEEQGAPVTLADRPAENDGDGLRVCESELNVFEDAAFGAIDFFRCGRIGGKALDDFEDCLLSVVYGLVWLELCKDLSDARVVHTIGTHAGGNGLLGVD